MTMAMFQAQLNTMVMWFDQWNESGQTVALFKMLTRLAPTQARFVSIALEHSLTECAELALREQEANNPGFISSLLVEKKETAMVQTLLHIPLLRPGNTEARCVYLALVPSLLSYSLESGVLVEEARQLLSYVLIHPALRDDRRIFEPWRRTLGEKIMTGSKGSCMTLSNESLQKTRRSNSLTPPFAVTPNVEWSSQDDLSMGGVNKARRFSLSSEQIVGPPLSPQSSQASSGSGSETHLDLAGYDSPEMRDVKNWLKSLRLHKYWRLFCHLSYEQILSITDENFDTYLEAGLPVTQGARRKIILSIVKLRERANLLAALERDVMNGGHLLTVMDELRQVLSTPIKAYVEEERPSFDDIPSAFTRVLGKVCTQLMVGNCIEEEAPSVFLNLLETILHHEAFSQQQKKKISTWRLQINQHLTQPAETNRLPPKVFTPPLSVSPRSHLYYSQAIRQRSPVEPLQHHNVIIQQRSVCKTTSAGSENEIDSRLESLCLSMTEHALGGSSEV